MPNIGTFDAAAVPESEFALLDEGTYRVIATASELKKNSKGTGTFILYTFEIAHGPKSGRKLWSRFTWEHRESEQAVNIGRRQFADLCEACGKASINAPEDLHGISVDVYVVQRPAKGQYKASNDITGFSTASQAPPPEPQPNTAGINPFENATAPPQSASEEWDNAAPATASEGWGA